MTTLKYQCFNRRNVKVATYLLGLVFSPLTLAASDVTTAGFDVGAIKINASGAAVVYSTSSAVTFTGSTNPANCSVSGGVLFDSSTSMGKNWLASLLASKASDGAMKAIVRIDGSNCELGWPKAKWFGVE